MTVASDLGTSDWGGFFRAALRLVFGDHGLHSVTTLFAGITDDWPVTVSSKGHFEIGEWSDRFS